MPERQCLCSFRYHCLWGSQSRGAGFLDLSRRESVPTSPKMANFAPLTAATGSFRAHHAVSMSYDVDGTILLRFTAVDTSKALCLRQESGKMGLLEASSGVRRSPGHQIYGTPAPSKRHFRHLHAWAGRQYLSRLAGDRHKATIGHGASPGAAKSQLDKIIGVTDGWEL